MSYYEPGIHIFPAGAMPIIGAVYNTDPLPFVAEECSCVGNESRLIDCSSPSPLGHPRYVSSLQEDQRHWFNVVGVHCDGEIA